MAERRKFTLPGPAGKLEGVVHLPEACAETGQDCELRAIALVAHPLTLDGGSMDNKIVTTLANTFAELGCAAFRFNFRGAGESEGEFTGGDGEEEDLVAVAQFARDQFGELPLILAGFSFGGYVAARASVPLKPRHLVLVGPAVHRLVAKYQLSSDMPQVPKDTLLIHGEKDEIIALDAVLAWARPQHIPVVVVPDSGHFFHRRLPLLADLVRKHFQGVAL
ncbi:alpha/beta fold hydrolase [Ferriphaselus sp. R-1]|uniref:alpha/beta hydrolase n=1 Tax=Ferriphaselus sp. R-1 TaxID=1485544 RepID=UPI000559983D|nr:alpha/beta fold hydrolase [Ferriphaselus sp. R-1]